MKFPNAYNGIKKIYLAEVLQILAVIMGISLIVVLVANSVTLGTEEMNLESTPDMLTAAFGIGATFFALIAFILNLFGVMSARKDDDNFKMALFAILIGIVCSAVSAVFNKNEGLKHWMETGSTLSSLFASYFVLSGIASLAGKYPDNTMMSLALKARARLVGTFSAAVILQVIVSLFHIQSSTVLSILCVIIPLMQLVSYMLYMMTLARCKKMLANVPRRSDGRIYDRGVNVPQYSALTH